MTEGGEKRTGRDVRVLPRTVIYDPELTLSLPLGLSITSGMNAIAHAAEGLYAKDGNPIMDVMAEEGIRAMAAALPKLKANPADLDARSSALYGAWLCGAVLGSVGMALHHKLCHTLGGSFNLPHAEVHTVILPIPSPTMRRRFLQRWRVCRAHWEAIGRPRRYTTWRATMARLMNCGRYWNGRERFGPGGRPGGGQSILEPASD